MNTVEYHDLYGNLIEIDDDKLLNTYHTMYAYYGVNGFSWNYTHKTFNARFFLENKRSIITEYLFWHELVNIFKETTHPYYIGINDFLSEYKDAVEKCINC